MTSDLSGGLDPALEYFLAETPANPDMRDSATLWIMDQTGHVALPRVTFDAVGARWDTPDVQLNFAHSDGRTLRVWSSEPGHHAANDAGHAAVRVAGPLRFECVEPFRRWTMEFDGMAMRSTSEAERLGSRTREPVPLAFRFEAEMAAPPWLMGGMTPEMARAMAEGDASALMGGIRYEQLCRVKGTVTLDGTMHTIEGTGMRVRRQGVRNMAAALGHCQHSALFPSGRAFGAIIMAKGAQGPEAFNEAFIIDSDGHRHAARVLRAPWMTRLALRDEAGLVLGSDIGEIRIEGETLLTMFDQHDFEMADTSILHQGTARYIWEGEETIGLIERCTLRDQLEE